MAPTRDSGRPFRRFAPESTTLVEEGVVDVEVIYTSDDGTERETRRLRLEKDGESFLIAGDKVV